MSHISENDDKCNNKENVEGITRKKKKTGTVNFNITDGQSEKSDEVKKKNSPIDEECSSKQPKLKKELTKLFDNFGEEISNPQLSIPPDISVETNQNNCTESSAVQSENLPLTDDYSRENNKESTEDTTLDGKFIEIKDEICECPAVKCICGQTDQNITDIDDSQINCKNNGTVLPCDFCEFPHTGHTKSNEKCDCNCDELNRVNRTDRYNYNQVQIRQNQIDESVFDNFFPRREKNKRQTFNKHHITKHDSGETIPQLYKANVKHFSDYGIVPERFTFKAVTGNLPGKLEYAQNVNCPYLPYMGPYSYPYKPSSKHRVNFMHDKFKEETNKKQGKKDKFTFKHFRRNKKTKHLEKNKCHVHDYKIHNKYNSLDKACMQFDGNEYMSTKPLPDRIDIYCFDHLNTSYFRTCDQPPPLITDIAIEKTEEVATRFWAEIFGFIHVIIAFFIAFVLQLYKFLLYSIVRPIMVGLVQLTSDYFFKPLLTITYNGFTQPLLVFLFNVAASFRDLCSPIAKALGYFVSEIAVLLKAIRLAECGRYAAPRHQMKDSCC